MKEILFAIIILAVTSFAESRRPAFEIKNFKKNYAKIKDDFYVSKYEVSNADYREFIQDLTISNETELLRICLPDTLGWNAFSALTPFVTSYFRLPAYNDYPVVGVSYEAANQYCLWLTEKYNEAPNRKYKKVHFKLPNREEWTFAANKGVPEKAYTWGSGFMQNNRKDYLCNFKHTKFVFDSSSKKYKEVTPTENESPETTTPAPIQAFYPNSFGLYNMCGNAAEMIEEKGIAKGGSYRDNAYNVRIASEKVYTGQQPDIGFRVAMKIIEN